MCYLSFLNYCYFHFFLKKAGDNLEEEVSDHDSMELDFDNHAPHWLLGRSGRTRKTMLDKMQKREKNRSAELTKLREELSREMEEKMNRKLKNILEKIVQMTSLQIDIDELLADDLSLIHI